MNSIVPPSERKKSGHCSVELYSMESYFDLINIVDDFILYNDVQYTKRDQKNRNKIKAPVGLIWLTIPVQVKGKYYQKINETLINDSNWRNKHWESIAHNYSKATFFHYHRDVFENRVYSWLKKNNEDHGKF